MPGHTITRSDVKNTALFDEYQCPHCSRLLKKAVQPLCGHRLCESCADELLSSPSPKCPQLDCQEDLQADPEEGAEYFPDRFVRREIEGLIVTCPHRQAGCDWEDRLGKFEDHLRACKFVSSASECPDCGVILTLDQMGSHKRVCPKAMIECPLADFGCSVKKPMLLDDLRKHVNDHGVEHLHQITEVLHLLGGKKTSKVEAKVWSNRGALQSSAQMKYAEFEDTFESKTGVLGPDVTLEEHSVYLHPDLQKSDSKSQLVPSSLPLPRSIDPQLDALSLKKEGKRLDSKNQESMSEIKEEHEERGSLMRICPTLQWLNGAPRVESDRQLAAEFETEDRDSLIENSNYDGTFIWNIPQFSQSLLDAQTGKYTSSLPFYTAKYGYKICLRLYILGDGIGENSHMSLFFVVMKGEFDNILKWPFTHKVTFKLINQTGGRDIIDTFQPDRMSSSFRKPKSDMNIASGCPRFVSHTQLKSGDFYKDDTITIKCSIDS